MLKVFSKVIPSLLLGGIATAQAQEAKRPNIIFILTDDLGYGDLGIFYQNSRNFPVNRNLPAMLTPNLDRLANEGLRLNRHYCPSPVSAPSRASLLLGVHQGHANVRDNQFDKVIDNNHTLGTVLKGAGYSTACIGKWGLGGQWGATEQLSDYTPPMSRGFDFFFGYMEHGDAHYHYPKEVNAANTSLHVGFFESTGGGALRNILPDMDKCYSTDIITARTKQWITDQHTAHPTQPFFIYLAYPAPHARLDVPTQAYPAGKGLSGGLKWLGTPGALINTASGTTNSWIHPDYANATWDNDHNSATAEVAWPDYAKRHATMIRRVDDALADLRQLLADLNIAENTLIVFTSDNGPHNEAGTGGSYTQDPQFFRSYGPLCGIKRDMWEGGVRVPAIVNWPTSIPAGKNDNHPSQFHDWMPTFAELAGVPQPERSDGVSLVPTLVGTGTQRESTIYSEYQNGGGATTPNYPDFVPNGGTTRGHMQMVFVNGYKAVRYNTTSNNTVFSVYDTATDPAEQNNLAGQSGIPSQQEIQSAIQQLRRSGGGVSRSYDSAVVPSVSTSSVTPGLHYRTFEKTTPWVPNWDTGSSVSEGSTASINPALRTRAEDIGLSFEGYVRIPSDGTYTFYLTSDTGAFVRLHKAQLIDADFGYTANSEVNSGTIPLKAGLHPIAIHYRHAKGTNYNLKLSWSGPGITKQEIPASALFQDGQPILTANPDETRLAKTANENASVLIDVLANDFGGENLRVSAVHAPANGTATIENNKVRYTPKPGFYGQDSFAYLIADDSGTAEGHVKVDVVQPLGSFLWLPFDETSGPTVYEAGGSPVGTMAPFDEASRINGPRNRALQFDGTGSEIQITANYQPPAGTVERTFTAWLKPDSTQPQLAAWLGYGVNSNGNRTTLRVEGGKLRCEVQGGFALGTRTLTDGQWHHVAVVLTDANRDGTLNTDEIKLYVDGQPDAISSSSARTINTTLSPLTVGGANHASNYHYKGGIDDLRIYSRALSATEIGEIKNTNSIAAAWFYRYTGNPAPTPADWNDEPNHDGISSLLNFALGGNPTTSSQNVLPVLAHDSSSGVSSFSFNRRQNIPPESYVVEISETLKADSWQPLTTAGQVSAQPDFSGFDLVRMPLPQPSGKSIFARLRVTLE